MPRELGHLGIVLPFSHKSIFRSAYTGQIMRGITQRMPILTDMHFFSMRQEGMVRASNFGEWDISGVLLLGLENDAYLKTFSRWGTPGVVVDYCSEGVPLDCVACDNRPAARLMVEQLISQGHRKVMFVGGNSLQKVAHPGDTDLTLMICDSSDVRERLAASVEALTECGAQVEARTCAANTGMGLIVAEWSRRRGSADCPSAFLVDSNLGANALVEELMRCGIRVPQDVSVGAVVSEGEVPFSLPQVTSCRFDFIGMGVKAVEILERRCREPGKEKPGIHRIGFKYVEGQTLGRNKAAVRKRK